MKLAFTGDLCFIGMEIFSDNPFKHILAKLSRINCVINLEAVFLPKSYLEDPIKDKLCLRQNVEYIKCLKELNPFLVNLSNNHINDYGNFGAINTMNQLKSVNLKYFGAGYSHENHNVFFFKRMKIVFLSYTTRSSDQSGSRLFNEEDFIGPKEFSFGLVERQIRDYKDYKKIVLFHWGVEDINYPLPEQRDIAKKLINSGIDLIIGNHSHVIQSYEQYNGKWVFYTLGHFYFPDFVLKTSKETYIMTHSKERKTSIVPVFDINSRSITLDKIYTISATNKYKLRFVNKTRHYNFFLMENRKIYVIIYRFHVFFKRLKHFLRFPERKVKKLFLVIRTKERV